MAGFTQDKRLLSITTPLGQDVLLLTGFAGTEAMSRLFRFELELLSPNDAIAPADIVGKAVTWQVEFVNTAARYFNGVVSRFAAGPVTGRGLRVYRAEVVPALWFLTRTADCRIFQNKSALDIVKAILGDNSVTFQDKTTGSYAARDYCVQYRETAFDFVSRLMEHEGIFYYFTHADGAHTMVLADAASAYADCAEGTVEYSTGLAGQNAVTAWEHRYEFRSGKWAHTDYNFETPATSLLTTTETTIPLADFKKYEVFDYAGTHPTTALGTTWVKVRMGEEETPYDTVSGASRCCSFTAGGKFTLDGHACSAENQAYLLTEVRHSATDPSVGGGGGAGDYSNAFACVPAGVLFRPARVTPKPFVRGIQTAAVVGPSGEEIYVDKYGRVKVQFFWDRVGTNDENSSCWIRVAENWAGKNWGTVFHPRVGQEVVVDFVEGDPDRPLITGRVYNATQMPPYDLPANMTQSGLKTRSSKQGGTDNFNELRFEDKKGSEDVYFHAEKDFHRVVENDDDLKVGHDQTIEVKNDRTETVKEGNETITIEQGNRTETVKQGNESVTVEQGDRTIAVKTGKNTLTVEGDRTVTVNTGNDAHTVKTGNRTVTVETGNDTHTVKTGNREVTVEVGNDSLTVKTGNQTTKVSLGASSIEAMQSITLKVGENSIKIDPSGITISGMTIKLQGQAQVQAQGPMIQVSADAMLQLKGGVAMIN